MFKWFKKRPQSPMDQLIVAMYGDSPPKKTAVLETATSLAHDELLLGLVSEDEVREIAIELDKGPIPYSTESLALSVALNLFKRPDKIVRLQDAQLFARMKALEWAKEGTVPPMLLKAFEATLYKLYKP